MRSGGLLGAHERRRDETGQAAEQREREAKRRSSRLEHGSLSGSTFEALEGSQEMVTVAERGRKRGRLAVFAMGEEATRRTGQNFTPPRPSLDGAPSGRRRGQLHLLRCRCGGRRSGRSRRWRGRRRGRSLRGRGCGVQISAQMNAATGNAQFANPVCESLFLYRDLVVSGCHGNRGWCVADKCAVNFNIRARRGGVDEE